MILYKDILKKLLFIESIIFFVIVFLHIVITLILSNYMYYTTILMYTIALCSILIISGFTIYFTLCTKRTNKLQKILHDDCDGDLAIDQTLNYIDNALNIQSKTRLQLFLTNCYFSVGNMNEAMYLYKSNEAFKLDISIDLKILWYHNFLMTAIKVFDYDSITLLRNYFRELQKIYPKKTTLINKYLEVEDKFEKYVNKDYIEVERYYLNLLNDSKNKLEKVIYNAYLANINKSLNKDYKKNVDFVLNNGNNLCYIKMVGDLK